MEDEFPLAVSVQEEEKSFFAILFPSHLSPFFPFTSFLFLSPAEKTSAHDHTNGRQENRFEGMELFPLMSFVFSPFFFPLFCHLEAIFA